MSARISVQIVPNARKDEVCGFLGDAVKIKIKAKPVEGKANEHLIKFLSEKLMISQKEISIISGFTSKHKILEINTIDTTEVLVRLGLDQDEP